MFHSMISYVRSCPVIVCFSILGGSFLFRNVLYFFFFLMSSSCQLFILVVLFVYLQWHTVGAEIKVPYVENPELWNFLPLKPGVGQSIALHASLTARKVSIVLSDNICLPSPFTLITVFSKIVSPYCFKKNVEKSQGSDRKWKVGYRHDQNITDWLHVHQPFTQLVWLWVKTFRKWVNVFKNPDYYYLFLKTVFANSLFSQFKEPALKVHQMSFI